jgi:hypothetical protein
MEDGDEDALKNWHIWCELPVKKYAEEYDRLTYALVHTLTDGSKVRKRWRTMRWIDWMRCG